MSTAEKMQISTSPEAEIIRQIENLIRQLAAGHASDRDLKLLQDLQRRRVEMMRYKGPDKKRA